MARAHERLQEAADRRLAKEHRKETKLNAGIVSTIQTFVTGQWVAPTFEQPELLNEADLEPLGTQLGRRVFTHRRSKRYGELRERLGVLTESDQLPAAPVVEERAGDGTRTWRVFDCVAPGTTARIAASPARVPPPPKPHRPVDALGHLFLAASRPERIVAVSGARSRGILGPPTAARPWIKAPEAPARGPAEILDRLTRAGATVRLSTDGTSVVVTTSGGFLAPGVLELVDRAGPLLVAYLSGSPLTCTVSRHDRPEPAVSIALGGAPWCGECDGAK